MREGFAFAITDEMIVPAHDFARSPLQESDQPRIRILGQLAIEWFPHRGAGHPARPIDAPLGSFFGLELLEVVTMTSLGSCCVNGKQGDRLAERNHFFCSLPTTLESRLANQTEVAAFRNTEQLLNNFAPNTL
jgi:hypothetical protein